VLVLTARADDELRVRLLEDGAGDFLGKPFLAAELRARVRQHSSRSSARATSSRRSSRAAPPTSSGSPASSAAHQRALEEATHAARLAAAQAEAAARLKSDLLGLVSHELTTPLQSLRLSTEILRHGATASRGPSSGRSSASSAPRASSSTTSRRSSSRRARRAVACRSAERVPLGQIVRGGGPGPRGAGRGEGARAPRRRDAALPFARTDAKLIRLVLTNLVGNALKHTARGRIDVGVGCDEEAHTVWVRDTGPGIPAANLTAIFEPSRRSSI